jgi:hypothetical protein
MWYRIALFGTVLVCSVVFVAAQTQIGGGGGGLPAGLTYVAPTFTVSSAGTGNGVLALSGNTSGTATFTAPSVAGNANNPVIVGNILAGPNGSSNGPTYTFSSAGNNGQYLINSTTVGMSVAGTNIATYTALGISATGLQSQGTAAGLTGTGACATITTQTGGAWSGRATCTAATAASTLTITPGSTATNGWACHVQDQTNRANLFQQTSTTSTACTLTITSVTQNDVFVFTAFAF